MILKFFPKIFLNFWLSQIDVSKENAHITQKKLLISEHLNEIGKNLDLELSKYDNSMLMGDLNAE